MCSKIFGIDYNYLSIKSKASKVITCHCAMLDASACSLISLSSLNVRLGLCLLYSFI